MEAGSLSNSPWRKSGKRSEELSQQQMPRKMTSLKKPLCSRIGFFATVFLANPNPAAIINAGSALVLSSFAWKIKYILSKYVYLIIPGDLLLYFRIYILNVR